MGHVGLSAQHVSTGKLHFQVKRRCWEEAGFPDSPLRFQCPQGCWLQDTNVVQHEPGKRHPACLLRLVPAPQGHLPTWGTRAAQGGLSLSSHTL